MFIRRVLLIFVCSVVFVIMVWISAATVFYLSNRSEANVSGRILPRHNWPEPLDELFKEADKRSIPVTNLEAYVGLHDNCYWKFESAPDLLDLMINRWKLTRVDSSNTLVLRIIRYMPVTLLSFSQDKESDYFVSPNCLPGGEWKGHQYCVIYDKVRGGIIVGYYYNF